MLVSLKACRKYINLDGLTAEEIANGLTYAGIEVEGIHTLASGTNLVIGQIKEVNKHPDSDHLHVLKVDLGSKYGVQQIVCGAPNVKLNLKVIVSRVGAKLPGGEIKQSVIRGIESNGMCCSLLELGVENKYLSEYQTKGIEELPDDAIVGNEDVLGYLGLDDTILDLKVLANRPDLLSLYNVAREIGAIFNREVKIPTYANKETFKTLLKVDSQTNLCLQFAGREIRDIKVKPSPKWMQEELRSMGVRSINNIVDIGNYVMLLTGQPLHMYDADKLPKKELIVRDDYNGPFVALDEKEYAIIKNDIVITSDQKVMCLGGVMGSLVCAVNENSKNIYIESASFDGAAIRHTSSRLGLVSESSSRFVKGTNHFQSREVEEFATYLLKEYADAKEISDIVSYQKEKYQETIIPSTTERINNRLGTHFTKTDIMNALTRLHFVVKDDGGEKFSAIVPPYRLDCSIDADLSEEVIRLLGFEHVETKLPFLNVNVGGRTLEQQRIRNIRDFLVEKGLDECLTYSMVPNKWVHKFNLLHDEEAYKIINPLTDEHESLRTHILESLLQTASYNVNRQNKNLALFEISDMISKASQEQHLAIVLVGNASLRGNMEIEPYNYYHMKGIVEGIFEMLGIEKSRYHFAKLTKCEDKLHPGRSAEIIFQNQVVGRFGELFPTLYNEYDLGKNKCVVLEMKLGMILSAKVSINRMEPISKFPYVTRDLALIVDKTVTSAEMIKTMKTTGKGILKDVSVFDVYEGENILFTKKSIAFTLTFSNEEKTLTDKEINDVFDRIKFELSKVHHAEIRMS